MIFLHKILNGVWMINPDFADNYLPYITASLRGQRMTIPSRQPESFFTIYNGSESDRSIRNIKDAPEGSIAVINIAGAITKHDQECGPDGMVSKSSVLRSCYESQNIKGVIIKVDSGGGEGKAMRQMAQAISERNKPVIGFVDDFACSAAYGILSGCDYIVANSEFAEVGSIGTYMTVTDYSKFWENEGIKLIDVYATASSDKNSEYLQAIKGNVEPLRKVADTFNEGFLSMIEKNREGKLTSGRDVWGTGKVFFSKDALKIGLIDEINTFTNTLKSFV